MEPVFFGTSEELRRWLDENHGSLQEAWIGLYKKASGRPSITWPELVDQLLCFGWIDGIRKSLDEASYAIRITPRRPRSNWSAVNLRRVPQLIEMGLMQPSGLAAWNARDETKARQYSFEREHAVFSPKLEAEFRAHADAWAYFQSQPPSYRKLATSWVMSAKREETRVRRLEALIVDSGKGQRIGPARR